MTNPGVTEAAPDAAAPAEAGVDAAVDQTVAEAPSQEPQSSVDQPPAEEPPAREYLDPDEVGDRYVRVKVDGEDIEVPLTEALSGYSRTEDYTRKRQADAEDLRLAQNLREHPGATLQMLAAQRGLTVAEYLNQGGVPGMPVQPQAEVEQPPEDPMERRLWTMERQLQEAQEREERRAADAELNAAVTGLKQQFGATDADVQETVQAAFMMGQQTGRPIGPEMLPLVFTSLQYTKAKAAEQAQTQHNAQQQAEAQARQAQAEQAAGSVATGGSAAGTTDLPTAGQHMTPSDAFNAALSELGVEL